MKENETLPAGETAIYESDYLLRAEQSKKLHSDKEFKINDIETKELNFFKLLKSVFSIFLSYKKYEIAKNEVQNTDEFKQKFKEIRQISHDFGQSTWIFLTWQTIFMILGIMFFVFVML